MVKTRVSRIRAKAAQAVLHHGRARNLLERALASFLFYSGATRILQLPRGQQVLILMYHRIVDPYQVNVPTLHPGIYITKHVFEMHAEYLARRYQVIGLEELIAALADGSRIPRHSCLITFDDGYRETYANAFPILQKYDLPATVFLVTDYVGTDRWFWWDQIAFLLSELQQRASQGMIDLERQTSFDRFGLSALASRNLPQEQKIRLAAERVARLLPNARDEAVHSLEDLVAAHGGVSYPGRLVLGWHEIAEMYKGRVTFGSHTATHADLTEVPREQAVDEIAESKSRIEAHLSTQCAAFSYPSGEYNDDVKEIVAGHYTCAFSTHKGFMRPQDDPHALPRIAVHQEGVSSEALFAYRISGVPAVFARVNGAL